MHFTGSKPKSQRTVETSPRKVNGSGNLMSGEIKDTTGEHNCMQLELNRPQRLSKEMPAQ